MVPKKDLVISQKNKYINDKETIWIQKNQRKYKLATIINKVLLTIPLKKIQYIFLKAIINQIYINFFSSFFIAWSFSGMFANFSLMKF